MWKALTYETFVVWLSTSQSWNWFCLSLLSVLYTQYSGTYSTCNTLFVKRRYQVSQKIVNTLYKYVFQTWPAWFWTIRSFQEAAFSDLIGCCLTLRRPGRCRRFCKLRSPTRKLRNWRKRSDHKIYSSKSDTNRRGCYVSKTSFKVTGTQYLIIKSPSDIIVHSKTTSTRQLLLWYYSRNISYRM